ncbi:MAG: LacI family transcriptional regulator [Microbacterium sp.]|nr:LacI family transcriptional regulator [Microbacterium sp.]MBA4346458.1 LacI family transcriptional regulator [Microbacterium sp.]
MTAEGSSGRVAPTLEMVAERAGVSRATVSRVVNGSPRVSDDTVAAVTAAIDALHYTPNRAARSLANRRSMAIALVIPEETSRFFGDPYFAAIVQGISTVLDETGYVLNLHLASSSGSFDKTVAYLQGGNADGALVVSHHTGDHVLSQLGASIPVVFGGRPLDPQATTSYFVDVDNTLAARAGTQYLLDQGRRRIGTIAGPDDMPAGIDRLAGWRGALTDAGLTTEAVVHGDFSLAGGVHAARELLDAHPDLDAIFVASDLMALGAISVLRERGIAVPEQVAVMGFDDSPAALASEIPLTTVRQPSVEQGERMARILLGLLEGENFPRRHIMPTEIVVRASA